MDLQTVTSHLSITNVGLVFQLAILEGLLSFDNALALAALVSKRLTHPADRRRALLWGIWGAYVTRVGIVFVGVWLMEQQWIKLLAGLYLIWLAINELLLKKPEVKALEEAHSVEEQTRVHASWKNIWKTILAVELMDLMFSIDSIAVALAVSNEKWVLIAGAVVGILMMRVAASVFIKLIDRFPVLVPTAFVMVAVAGLKVVLEVTHLTIGSYTWKLLGLHFPEYVFLPVLIGILLGAVMLNVIFPEKFAKE